jgi:hypothetical protein
MGSYDAVGYALALDAITHAGRASGADRPRVRQLSTRGKRPALKCCVTAS